MDVFETKPLPLPMTMVLAFAIEIVKAIKKIQEDSARRKEDKDIEFIFLMTNKKYFHLQD
jgi:hypothetical protein